MCVYVCVFVCVYVCVCVSVCECVCIHLMCLCARRCVSICSHGFPSVRTGFHLHPFFIPTNHTLLLVNASGS